jgi:hypothetical protein
MTDDENNPYEDEIEVSDDENYVDKKTKQRLLNTRQLLTQANNELTTGRLIEPDVQYSHHEANAAWANLVQSYIYDLSILLENDDIPTADYYRENVEIGQVRLIPEDTQGIPFSQIMYDDISEEDIIMQSNGLSRGADLPEPVTVTFNGLSDIAETDLVLSHSWVVTTNPRAAKPNQNRLTVQAQQPVPKEIFQKALVQSDQFLQSVGIGLDITASDYFGGDEPGV